jgi:hypothetical protein
MLRMQAILLPAVGLAALAASSCGLGSAPPSSQAGSSASSGSYRQAAVDCADGTQQCVSDCFADVGGDVGALGACLADCADDVGGCPDVPRRPDVSDRVGDVDDVRACIDEQRACLEDCRSDLSSCGSLDTSCDGAGAEDVVECLRDAGGDPDAARDCIGDCDLPGLELDCLGGSHGCFLGCVEDVRDCLDLP